MAQDKDQLHALLADYVEGSLSEQQIDEAEAYLNANPGVRSVVDKLMIDSEALRALPPVRSPVDYSDEIRTTAERDLLLSDAPDAGRRPLSGPTLALAAMLLVGLGLGGAAYWVLIHRPTTTFDLASTAATATTTKSDVPAARPADAEPTVATAPAAEATRASPDVVALAAPSAGAPSASAPMTPGEAPGAQSAAPPAVMARADADDHAAMSVAASPRVGATADAAQRSRTEDDAVATGRGAIGGGVWPPTPEPKPSAPMQAASAPPAGVPPTVQAIVDAAPVEGGRRAIAVVVNDVGAVDAVRRLVRDNVALEQQTQNVYEKISNANVLAATMPVDLGPLVASDVPAELERRLRAAVAAEGAGVATIYDVAPARASADAPARNAAAPQEQRMERMQQMQQVSGAMMPKAAAAASRPTNVDVFVVVVPGAMPTTSPVGPSAPPR